MAIVEITGVLIDGIVTAVPKNRIDNLNDPNIEKEHPVSRVNRPFVPPVYRLSVLSLPIYHVAGV